MPSAFNIYVLPDTCANNIQQRYEALDRVIAETHKSVRIPASLLHLCHI